VDVRAHRRHGAHAALGGTAACLVLVALLFARLAPESYRARL
jgi:hypothetical protein